MKTFVVFGTRPEAIKMCPLVKKLKEEKNIECIVCLTGQHKEMLRQVMDAFDIKENYNLEIMKDSQTLTDITTAILTKIEPVLQEEKPEIVLVHGDTTTSFAAALAAFYQKIPVGHVEAGLRTGNIIYPFPEEMNRLMTDRISSYFFAPTENNRKNLAIEGILNNVYVTGNTVIDAFQYTVKDNYRFSNETLNDLDFESKKVITLTAHRRENIGQPLRNICAAVKRIAAEYPNVIFVYPVHLNPAVREIVFEMLVNISNIKLLDPVDVLDMHNLLARSYMIMTDSGGLQEEAPHFGKPVLVLRTETERPEAVEAGTVKVTGVDEHDIYMATRELLENENAYKKMAHSINPFGDGHASEKIVDILLGFSPNMP